MRRAILLCVCSLMGSSAWALDTVRMKNGDVYRGEVVERSGEGAYIQIRFAGGNEKRLKYEDIYNITTEPLEPVPPHSATEPLETMPQPRPTQSENIVGPSEAAPVTTNSGRKSEIFASSSAGVLTFAGGTTSVALSGGFGFLVSPGIQLGFAGAWAYSAQAENQVLSATMIAGRITINLPAKPSIEDAFLITGGIGPAHVYSLSGLVKNSTTALALGGSLGGRMQLSEGFNYVPSVGIAKVTGAGAEVPEAILIQVIGFSFTY